MKKFICDGEKYKFGDGYIYMQAITVSRYRTQYPYIESICDQGFK